MGWRLKDSLSFCIAGGRAIFLDLEQDRYFALTEAADAAFRQMIASEPLGPCEQQAMAPLVRAGFLTPCEGEGRPAACRLDCPPIADMQAPAPTARQGWRLPAIIAALLAARSNLNTRPLPIILADIERRKALGSIRQGRERQEKLAAISAGFELSGLLFSSLDQCLPRSIAMTHYLLGRGYRPQLVLAVMNRPFQAHCWVQIEGVVLNDGLDHVRSFTPILVI